MSLKPNVVLVSLPWTTVAQPSLGLAVLKSHLTQEGIAGHVYHANLDLLKYLSHTTYDVASQCWGVNEFLFTALLDEALDEHQLLVLKSMCVGYARREVHPDYSTPADLFALFLKLRNQIIPQYLADCAQRILEMNPTLVGFTCMFDQTIASVVLAKLLKQDDPSIVVALGGYAVQHENGLEVLKAFPHIDCICRGDGEPVISRLARASVGMEALEKIAGIALSARLKLKPSTTSKLPVKFQSWTPKANLAEAMPPNYDDWFEDIENIEREQRITIRPRGLPIESSRGCWWGEKHHCTFCGIDEETLKY